MKQIHWYPGHMKKAQIEVQEKLKEKIQASQDKQEQSFNMKEKDSETKKIMNEMEQLKE